MSFDPVRDMPENSDDWRDRFLHAARQVAGGGREVTDYQAVISGSEFAAEVKAGAEKAVEVLRAEGHKAKVFVSKEYNGYSETETQGGETGGPVRTRDRNIGVTVR